MSSNERVGYSIPSTTPSIAGGSRAELAGSGTGGEMSRIDSISPGQCGTSASGSYMKKGQVDFPLAQILPLQRRSVQTLILYPLSR